MACNTTVTQALDQSCDNAFGAIKQEIRLINHDDIDRDASTYDEGKNVISELLLKTGKKAVPFISREMGTGISAQIAPAKDDLTGAVELTHTVNLTVFNLCETSQTLIKELQSAKVGVVVKTYYPDNACAFQMYGFKAPLMLDSISGDTSSNKGAIALALTTAPNATEDSVQATITDPTIEAKWNADFLTP